MLTYVQGALSCPLWLSDPFACISSPSAWPGVNRGVVFPGARATATLLHEMARRGKSARFGIVSMCIGSGMGEPACLRMKPI